MAVCGFNPQCGKRYVLNAIYNPGDKRFAASSADGAKGGTEQPQGDRAIDFRASAPQTGNLAAPDGKTANDEGRVAPVEETTPVEPSRIKTTMSLVIDIDGTQPGIQAPPRHGVVNRPVVITATVTGEPGAGAPTGEVVFTHLHDEWRCRDGSSRAGETRNVVSLKPVSGSESGAECQFTPMVGARRVLTARYRPSDGSRFEASEVNGSNTAVQARTLVIPVPPGKAPKTVSPTVKTKPYAQDETRTQGTSEDRREDEGIHKRASPDTGGSVRQASEPATKEPGETTGRITIKLKVAGGGAGLSHQFQFKAGAGPNTPERFSLKAAADGLAGERQFDNLVPRTYTITADPFTKTAYDLARIACNSPVQDGLRITVPRRAVEIDLVANRAIVCTFEAHLRARHVPVPVPEVAMTKTQWLANDYLGTRNTLLLSHRPRLTDRLERLFERRRPRSGGRIRAHLGAADDTRRAAFSMDLHTPLPFDFAIGNQGIAFSTSASRLSSSLNVIIGDHSRRRRPDKNRRLMRWDVWIEGRLARLDGKNNSSGTFGVIYAGADVLFRPHILVGVFSQFDWLNRKYDEQRRVKGNGWMIGTYTATRFAGYGYADIQAGWGLSTNAITPLGTYTDRFRTSRLYLSASLSASFDFGNWNLRPDLSAQYLSERQGAYTDSAGRAISAQKVFAADVRLGPRIAYTYRFAGGGRLVPWARLEGVYAYSNKGDFPNVENAPSRQHFSAKAEAGVRWYTAMGAKFMASGSYGGIGSDTKSIGASARLDIPF